MSQTKKRSVIVHYTKEESARIKLAVENRGSKSKREVFEALSEILDRTPKSIALHYYNTIQAKAKKKSNLIIQSDTRYMFEKNVVKTPKVTIKKHVATKPAQTKFNIKEEILKILTPEQKDQIIKSLFT